ncbi:MAG: hypothetical protein QM535_22490 [Limnohabitans sp.]|nr:hypothetical protein [Limnohabitans sp.]
MLQDRIEFYKEIEKQRNSKLLVYITGDRAGLETQIYPEVLDYFIDHLDGIGKSAKISLLLYTRGGHTLSAWSLVNLIQQFCDNFEVVIPSKCHSAGTLMCLGANTIVMTKQATLGPIDPSINGPLNPQNPQFPNNPGVKVPVSVESIKGYFEFAKKDLKIQNESALKDIYINISNQVHPLVLGDIYRSRAQIQMLAKKLLSRQLKNKSKIENIISFLCSDSGSHDYTIYRNEAQNELGLNIEKPDEDLYKIIKNTFDDIKKELDLNTAFDPNVIIREHNIINYTCRRALIESVNTGTHVYLSEGSLIKHVQNIPQMPPLPPIERTVVDDQRKFEGWRFEKTK